MRTFFRSLTLLILTTASIAAQSVTSVIVPAYIEGNTGTNANRLPYAFRARLSGLLPNATYRYFNQIVISSDASTSNGAGNCIFASPSGPFVRTTSPGLSTAGTYGTFTTSDSGTYEGWFVNEPTGNSRFLPGRCVFMRIALNDGGSGTTVATRLTVPDSVRVLKLDGALSDTTGTGLRSSTQAVPRDFVVLYDDTSGGVRAISASFVESDGTANTTGNSYSPFYANNVNGLDGAFGLVIPNNLPNGIRRVERRSLSDGSLVTFATDEDGVWPSGVTTVNPAGGATEMVLQGGDVRQLGPQFASQTSQLSFGEVAVLSSETDSFVVSNPGSMNLSITDLASSASIFVIEDTTSITLAPGDSTWIHVTFAPQVSGAQQTFLIFTHSGMTSPDTVVAAGTGVAPAFDASLSSLTFGQVVVGESVADSVVIRNTGNALLTIAGLTLDNLSEFGVAESAPMDVAVGDSVIFHTTFHPTTTGSHAGLLIFTHNGPTSPDTVSLSGTGVAPGLLIYPSTLSFGGVRLTESRTDSLLLKNTGDGQLTVSEWLSTDTAQFSIVEMAPVGLPPGDSAWLHVVFHPMASGNLSAEIVLVHNGASSPDSIPLDGEGLWGDLSVAPLELSFGLVQIGLSKTDTVTLRNTGSAALVIDSLAFVNGEDFSTQAVGPWPLNPDDSVRIGVRFHPSSSGTRQGFMLIHHDAGTPDSVGLLGNGVEVQTVLLPEYIEGQNGTNSNRIPYAFRLRLTGLLPVATYRFTNQIVTSADAATTSGAGNCLFVSASGDFVRTTNPSLATAGNYGTFTTGADGSYEGWFATEPTGNARFVPGKYLFPRLALNDGASGTTIATRVTTTDSIRVVKLAAVPGDTTGTGLRCSSTAGPKDFVFVYDHVDGTDRPVSGTFIESDGTANTTGNSYAAFYANSVNSIDGAFGLVVPNALPEGIRRFERRSLATGGIVAFATDADGVWPSGVNTVNPAGGTAEIVLTNADVLGLGSTYPQISVDPDTLDFGGVFATYADTMSFRITNIGTDTLHVTNMFTGTGEFEILGGTNFDVPASGHRDVPIVFSTVYIGYYVDTVAILSDAASGSHNVVLRAEAVGIPFISIFVDTVFFDVHVGETDSSTYAIHNMGSGPLNIGSITAGGADWLMQEPANGIVEPADSLVVKVKVNATGLSAGTYVTTVAVMSNDPENPVYEHPVIRLQVDDIVGVDPGETLPTRYALHANYPNPFNPSTTIKYELKDAGPVALKIYNMLGQEVRTLVAAIETAGYKTVVWDGRNDSGGMVSSGIYLYRLETTHFTKSRKMLLIK